MRFEYSKTGMWTVLVGAAFWVMGFILYFVLSEGLLQSWTSYTGMILLIAGLILIVAGGQIIRVSIKGETVQPTSGERKTRLLVCPECSMDNPEDAKYCLKCGKKLKKPWSADSG